MTSLAAFGSRRERQINRNLPFPLVFLEHLGRATRQIAGLWHIVMSSTNEQEEQVDELDPSVLGTKQYWDSYYERDLANAESDIPNASNLESWFDDVGAPEKVADYLISELLPLIERESLDPRLRPRILDLGTGNGSTLISLAVEHELNTPMIGVDYSESSIELAKKLWSTMLGQGSVSSSSALPEFYVFDILNDVPERQPWWLGYLGGFDVVLDKGTFDAISLSSDVILDEDGKEGKGFEVYPAKAARLVKEGGFFMITSCNWTEDEVVRRFTQGDMTGVFEVFHKVKYPIFQFGGQQGQGVASICFRKTAK